MNHGKKILIFVLACIFMLSGCKGSSENTASQSTNSTGQEADEVLENKDGVATVGDGKSAVIYFSRVGNTDFPEGVDTVTSASLSVSDEDIKGNAQMIAEWIADEAGCDLFEILTEKKYPADYDETVDLAKEEQSESARPTLVNVPDTGDYDVIYLVFPNWWADLPMGVYSFLDQADLSGKRINVFITHEGSRFSGTVDTIKEEEPDAEVVEAVSIRGGSMSEEEDTVRQWVRDNRPVVSQASGSSTSSQNEVQNPDEDSENAQTLKMMIDDVQVDVEWEDNESVTALKELAASDGLEINMSRYGGFEQVGPIGQSVPANDEQTTTTPGDIVLYSGNQIVVFYGSNSWSYTRLGRIKGKTAEELAEILGNDDAVLKLEVK